MPFQPGQSGNPGGRPKRPKPKTRLGDILSADDAEAIMQAVIDQAKAGDLQACKMILDRLHAPLRAADQCVVVDLPRDAAGAATGILEAVSTGIISPDQAARLMATVSDAVRIIEATELEGRITALEMRNRPFGLQG